MMIKNISPNQNEIEFEFQEKITGVFFAFGKEYLLNKTNSLKVKNDESLIFDDNYFYIDENKKKHKINFSKFSFNDTSITNPSFRDKGLTHENILFICEKIFKNTKKTLEKCNMLVVMSYRAIDLNNEHYARKTLEDISVFLRELNELIKTPTTDIKTTISFPKKNPSHVYISMCYSAVLLSIFLNDEKKFAAHLNSALNISRKSKDKRYISGSYFTLVLLHRIAFLYSNKKTSSIIYKESLFFSKISLSNHTSNLPSIRLKEFSNSIFRLSALKRSMEEHDYNQKELFINSLRCTQGEILYKNFIQFHKNEDIDIFGSCILNSDFIDETRDIALKIEKTGNIKLALKVMLEAKKYRPNGKLINEKIEHYKSII